jgi:3-dehydroquinate synthase
VQVPTTLLAQIDSSVGGKTAVNIPEGKNLVGTFYHPSAVYIDMDFLKTLKNADFADGMAELVKYALIKDEQMFRLLELSEKIDAASEVLQELVIKCLEIKRDVVMEDELDKGERMKLNFGHTIGHGLERMCAQSGTEMTHGQGVARGMAAITAASERMGLTQAGTTQRIISVLEKQELPTAISEFDKGEILRGILVDKKNIADKINLILIEKPGASFIHTVGAPEAEGFIG